MALSFVSKSQFLIQRSLELLDSRFPAKIAIILMSIIILCFSRLDSSFTLLDYIGGGCAMNITFAIDFTVCRDMIA